MRKLRDFIITVSNNIEDKMNSYFDNVVSNAFASKDVTEKHLTKLESKLNDIIKSTMNEALNETNIAAKN